jgi:hypothetical protein
VKGFKGLMITLDTFQKAGGIESPDFETGAIIVPSDWHNISPDDIRRKILLLSSQYHESFIGAGHWKKAI